MRFEKEPLLSEVIMTIRDIMTEPAVVISEKSSVIDAARVMREHNIGSVPVADDEGRVVGIVTDRDIVIRDIARGLDALETPVSEIMTTNVKTVEADADVYEVADIMSRDKVRRIPVVENGEVVGIVALGDVALCRDFKIEAAEALCEISKGCHKKYPDK